MRRSNSSGRVKTGLVVGTIAANLGAGLLIVSLDDQPGEAHLAKAPAVTPPTQLVRPPAAQPPLSAPKPQASPPASTAFVIRRILPVTGPMRYGQWYWDDKGVPAGPLVITVDLDARVLSIFRDGYEIGTSVVLLGADSKPTPLGIFPITQKDIDHHSNLYNDAPMPYMQRLTNDGVTIHGDDIVENGYASHGCVGVPIPFAKKLFDITHLGDKVYITRGRMVGVGDSLVRK